MLKTPSGRNLLNPKQNLEEVAEGFRYASIGKDSNAQPFEQLQNIDKKRSKLNKKVKTFNQLYIINSFVGTVLPSLYLSRQAWLTAIEYVIIRVLMKYRIIVVGDDVPEISTTITSIIGGFMSFFLVFFVSQAYNRFMSQYDISMRIQGRIANLTVLARNVLPPAEALRLVRYSNAAQVVGYIGFSDAYTYDNLFRPLNEKYHLLTKNEEARLMEIGLKKGGACAREVITWIIDLLYTNYREANDGNPDSGTKTNGKATSMDMNTLQTMVNEALTLRGAIANLYDFADQTIPFSYMHLLVVIGGSYLILMAYAIATYFNVSDSVFPDLLGAFMLCCNIVFVIGMAKIGAHMIDPYGSEVQDLAVPAYLEGAIRNCRQIMNATRFVPGDISKEQMMDGSRPVMDGYTSAASLAYAPCQVPPLPGRSNYDSDDNEDDHKDRSKFELLV